MQRPIQPANATSSRSLACEKVPTRTIAAATPMAVPIDRKPAFSRTCPRVGKASMATVIAADEADLSCSQKPAYSATTTAIQMRNANDQEASGRPAKAKRAGAVLTVIVGSLPRACEEGNNGRLCNNSCAGMARTKPWYGGVSGA